EADTPGTVNHVGPLPAVPSSIRDPVLGMAPPVLRVALTERCTMMARNSRARNSRGGAHITREFNVPAYSRVRRSSTVLGSVIGRRAAGVVGIVDLAGTVVVLPVRTLGLTGASRWQQLAGQGEEDVEGSLVVLARRRDAHLDEGHGQ